MKIAGTASIVINGQKYLLRGNMTISIGKHERESIYGLDGYHGIKELARASWIECDLTDMPELDQNIIEDLADVTVNVQLINGKSCVLRNAYQVKPIEVKAEDGLFSVRFEGPSGEWLTATSTTEQVV